METSIWAPRDRTNFRRRLERRRITARLDNIRMPSNTDVDDHHLPDDQVTFLKNATHTNANKLSRLLNLPGEIRDLIWRDLLTSSTGLVRVMWGDRKNQSIMFHYHVIDEKSNPRVQIIKERIHLSILFTSRRIYNECANMFWGTNIFIQANFLETSGMLKEDRLLTYIHRNITHVQLHVKLLDILYTAKDADFRYFQTTLAILEKMADPNQGSLKSITIRLNANVLHLKMVLDLMRRRPTLLKENRFLKLFWEFNERMWVAKAAVKGSVDMKIDWHTSFYTDEEKRLFRHQYQSKERPNVTTLLEFLAECLGGINGTLWADENLCFENIDGKMEARADPFPLDNLKEEIAGLSE